jgi:hypothetical protein
MPALTIVIVVALIVSACSPPEDFTTVASDPERLLGGLMSYSAPEDVRRALGNPEWTVREESRLAPNDRRPPYSFLSVVIRPYEDKGDRGELLLTFFNSRLMSTVFYPHNPAAYRARLEEFPSRDNLRGELRSRHLRVWSAVDYGQREYFLWGDVRLLEQQTRWIMRYS